MVRKVLHDQDPCYPVRVTLGPEEQEVPGYVGRHVVFLGGSRIAPPGHVCNRRRHCQNGNGEEDLQTIVKYDA